MTVLRRVREQIFNRLGRHFEGREWEETLLYSMAANCNVFGTGIIRFSEKQLYKKFLDVIEIPPGAS
jgi:hypothetical protein